jgi:D-sedoheptulose 7-phosphate isomerase
MGYIEEYFEKLKRGIDSADAKLIDAAANELFSAWKNRRNVFVFGNGGSAATASHMACDLNKTTLRNYEQKKRFRAFCLNDNVPTMTAYANDFGFENIFAEQMKNFIEKNDVVVAISASGNSPNVVKAVELAKKNGAKIIGFGGFKGGKLKEMSDIFIWFRGEHYGRVEDFHMILDHLLTERLKELISKEKE